MVARRLDGDIDRLYQLPLAEFTAARNALAKQAGADSDAVRSLGKPPLAAWIVNQLYWRRRAIYDALIEAAETLRATHKSVLSGRSGDLRAAGQAHDGQLEAATKATMLILADEGHPVADATKQAVVTTLRALPVDEAPGRLSRTLQPGGFEMLAGLSLGRGAPATRAKTAAPPVYPGSGFAKGEHAPGRPASRPDNVRHSTDKTGVTRENSRAVALAREAAAAQARRLRTAEHAAQREEFELARTSREADKAAKTAADARAAFEHARQALEEADAALTATVRTREAAERRARRAEQVLREIRELTQARA